MGINFHSLLLSTDEKMKLLEDFASLFEFGDAPQTVADDFIEYGNSTEKKLGKSIDSALSKGDSFTDGLKGWFPPLAIEAIRVGEASGDLASGCKNANRALEATKVSMTTFLNGIRGPIFAVLISISFISVAGKKIMPMAAGSMPIEQWPWVSQIVYGLGTNVTTYWLIYIILLCLIPIVLWGLITTWVGFGRSTANKWPLFKQYNLIMGIQILNGLSQLCRIGRSLDESISVLEKAANEYTLHHLSEMKSRIQESEAKGNLGQLLDTGLLEERVVGRLKRVTSAVFEDHFLLGRAAIETNMIYTANVKKITGITTIIARIIAYSLALLMFAGFVMMVLPQINQMRI